MNEIVLDQDILPFISLRIDRIVTGLRVRSPHVSKGSIHLRVRSPHISRGSTDIRTELITFGQIIRGLRLQLIQNPKSKI